MPLGVVEEAYLEPVHDLLGAHHPCPSKALGLRERGLDVGDFYVEGDVARIAVGPGADAAADSDAVGVSPLSCRRPGGWVETKCP